MARTNTQSSTKGKTMTFNFNPEANAFAPSVKVELRQECRDLDSSLSYIRDRLAEFKRDKAKAEKGGEKYDCPWISTYSDAEAGEYLGVTANLKSMPIYWMAEFTNEKVKILNPDGSTREERPFMKGMSRYRVQDEAEGWAMLEALASGENDALNERVRLASEAYVDVVDNELPHIEEKAAMLYNKSKWPEIANDKNDGKKYGQWEERDGMGANGPVFSKEKTNKKNMYKQTARRQLGYERWSDVHRVAKK